MTDVDFRTVKAYIKLSNTIKERLQQGKTLSQCFSGAQPTAALSRPPSSSLRTRAPRPDAPSPARPPVDEPFEDPDLRVLIDKEAMKRRIGHVKEHLEFERSWFLSSMARAAPRLGTVFCETPGLATWRNC